jgi:uncharacterized protein (TIGR02453 family)
MPPFTGFPRGALPFLESLAQNNNRDWFTANRATYDSQIAAPMAALISALAFTFATEGIPLTGDPKRSMFRVNRDVRFSKDKSPYKTNASCVLSRDGSKQGIGILYIQIGGADGAFMAQGFYGPEPDHLHALRQAIAAKPKLWEQTLQSLLSHKLALSQEDKLVRIPKGFEAHADAPFADALRLKSFVIRRPITPARIHTTKLIDDIVTFAKQGAPLLSFGRTAIDQARAQA